MARVGEQPRVTRGERLMLYIHGALTILIVLWLGLVQAQQNVNAHYLQELTTGLKAGADND